MLKSLLLSVIIPVYNVAPYLEQCLDSVINQTYQNLEIICINDGSTDNSLEILERYKKKDKRIKVFSTENRGLSSARNLGLDSATGELVAFVDSDDFLYLDAYEKAVNEFLKNPNLELVTFNYSSFYENGKNVEVKLKQEYGAVWCRLYKLDLINKYNIRFIPNKIYEDVYFSKAYQFCCNSIKHVDEPLYYYRRQRPGSICAVDRQANHKKIMDWLYNLDALVQFAKTHNVYEKNEDIICGLYVRLAKCPTEESLQKRVFSRCDQQILQSNCSKEIKEEYLRIRDRTIFDKVKDAALRWFARVYLKFFA